MMLVGPLGNTAVEKFFTILTLLVTVGVFAYIISKVAEVISDIN